MVIKPEIIHQQQNKTIMNKTNYYLFIAGILISATSLKAQFGLHVAENQTVLFGKDTSDFGTKLMWIPSKSALRAGYADHNEWNYDSIGASSLALGKEVRATGAYAVALGLGTTASGYNAMSTGYLTKASGNYSLSQGYRTRATGWFSTAMGGSTNADAYAVTAIGTYNVGGGDPDNFVLTDPILEVGNGFTSGDKKNALTVRKNGSVEVGNPGEGNTLLLLASERSWKFSQYESGASTALKLSGTSANNNNKDFLIDTDGNVGISDDLPAHKLSLGNSTAITKLALYEAVDNSSNYGMGVVAGQFRFNLGNPQARYAFFDGPGSGAGEIFTIKGDGTIKVNGTTVHSSDRNKKESIRNVNYANILDQVKKMPIYEWQYKMQNKRHIGPMAQDFHAAFGLGDDPTGIASVDIDGVALAAIKALINEVGKLKEEIAVLKAN